MTAIPREPLHCTLCQAPLSDDLTTFGDHGSEICADCWYDLPENNESWYGSAPHHHDMTLTGDWIGSTVYEPTPEPDKHGVIALPNGTFFVPDAEVDGTAGMYYIRHPYDGGQVR
jgi:hypothetical protein